MDGNDGTEASYVEAKQEDQEDAPYNHPPITSGGRCPFGFGAASDSEPEGDMNDTAKAGEGLDADGGNLSDGTDADWEEEGGPRPAKRKGPKQPYLNEATKIFDKEKDPVSWFFKNQIKSEQEFQARKKQLQAIAKQRLDDIMAKKGKVLEWQDAGDFDGLSIRSSELSELDSEVDSLGSLHSCADAWIESAHYTAPAEVLFKWMGLLSLVALGYATYSTYEPLKLVNSLPTLLANTWWPIASASVSLAAATITVVLLMSTYYRSRRMLLGGLSMAVLLYGAAVALGFAATFQPVRLDVQMSDKMCKKVKGHKQHPAVKSMCKQIPGLLPRLKGSAEDLMWCNIIVAGVCIGLAALGIWYILELTYIEKKAIKHKRRQKRSKFSIPWEKVKLVGPVTHCGTKAGANNQSGRNTGGGNSKGWSWGFGAKKSDSVGSGKCPMGFGGGGVADLPAGDKKVQ